MEQEKYGFFHFFWTALTSRYGFDEMYYHSNHMSDGNDGLKSGVNLPWWSCIVSWASRMNDRWTLLQATVDRSHGWLRYEEDYKLGADCDNTRPWWKCPRFGAGHFYILKTIFCIVFCYGRSPKKEMFHDWVNVACWNFHPMCGEYSGTNWEALDVGHGVLCNWFIRSYNDSSC